MDLDAAAVDEEPFRDAIDPGELGEDTLPHAAFGPAPEAVVERLFRTVDMFRAIAPATTALQSLDNPGKHALTRCGTEMEEAKASCRWVVRAQPERRATVSKEGLAGEGEAEPSSSPLSWGVVRRPCRRQALNPGSDRVRDPAVDPIAFRRLRSC